MTIVGAIIGILIGALFSGLIIWIVGKLGLGLEVSGFGPAFVAAIVIAGVSWLVKDDSRGTAAFHCERRRGS